MKCRLTAVLWPRSQSGARKKADVLRKRRRACSRAEKSVGRVLLGAAFCLSAHGCANQKAAETVYLGTQGASDIRAQVRIENARKVVVLLRWFSGESVVRSAVIAPDGCAVFSPESWTCRSGGTIWTLDNGVMRYWNPIEPSWGMTLGSERPTVDSADPLVKLKRLRALRMLSSDDQYKYDRDPVFRKKIDLRLASSPANPSHPYDNLLPDTSKPFLDLKP